MPVRKTSLGRPAVFYIPSLKLKMDHEGRTIEDILHGFLLEKYGGYTAASSTVYGFWKTEAGKLAYGEHRQYTVAFSGKHRVGELEKLIADIARLVGEQCIYLETGEDAWLIYASA